MARKSEKGTCDTFPGLEMVGLMHLLQPECSIEMRENHHLKQQPLQNCFIEY